MYASENDLLDDKDDKDIDVHLGNELFTSAERIHLVRLVLEQPIAKGGCGIDIDKFQEKGWFEAIPVHDGTYTKTARFQDDIGAVDGEPRAVELQQWYQTGRGLVKMRVSGLVGAVRQRPPYHVSAVTRLRRCKGAGASSAPPRRS